jgi:replicative DNA helicase
MRDLMSEEFLDKFPERQTREIEAVPTPLGMLNSVCLSDGGGVGWALGWTIIAAGNPGHGKSNFALNCCASALKAGWPVAYVTLEMSSYQLATRAYSIISGVPISKIERGGFAQESWDGARTKIADLPALWVPNEVLSKWGDVVEFVKKCYEEEGCRYIIVDYLQLIQHGTEEAIQKAMQEIITELRAWAVNKKAIVLALSQYNRVTSAAYDTSPKPQSLWGGMILEASADQVLCLDHSRFVRDNQTSRTHLLLNKNRHGPTREIPIEWNYRTLTMREALPDEEAMWP